MPADPQRDTRPGSRGAGVGVGAGAGAGAGSGTHQDSRRAPPSVAKESRPALKQANSVPLVPMQGQAGRTSSNLGAVRDGGGQEVYKDHVSRESISPTTSRARALSSNASYGAGSQRRNRDMPRPEPVADINLAIVGAPNVGKSTFIKHFFALPGIPVYPTVTRSILIDGIMHSVRMIEVCIEDIGVEEDDDSITWPDWVNNLSIPSIDAVLTLYDVGDKTTFDDVPGILTAVDKASLPSVLISCKCDLTPPQRQVDPAMIEQRAKSVLRKINTIQFSRVDEEAQRHGFPLIMKAISAAGALRDPLAARRRALSSNLQPGTSSKGSRPYSHTRASSEQSTLHRTDSSHGRHDSSMIEAESSGKATGTGEVQSSFPLDESQESGSAASASCPTSIYELDAKTDPDTASEAPSDERGCTFDQLVDRLLLLPKSKSDSKFAAIFLALYRKFAAPGQLLEAIVYRFEALENENVAFMSRTVAQLRYLSVVEQWIGTYPGDFAHPQTRRRMQTFVSKLAGTRIFAAAAREMCADLDVVAEDDDTDWACSDQARELELKLTAGSQGYKPARASTLLDDPKFEFSDTIVSLSLNNGTPKADISSPAPHSSNYGMLHSVDTARRLAQTLVPVPRHPLNKMHWRSLLEFSSEAIARELTRIDWIMFSAIRPRDIVRHVTLSTSKKANCTSLIHVSRMIDHFNHVRDWVANLILLRDKAKHRVQMLEKLMHVARRLREFNNYNSLGAFLAGINSASVTRLNSTREFLTLETQKDWMKLEILMAHTKSYSAYRLAWENSSGERIPFLPLPIRDLVGALEGNKTWIGDEDDGRINWRKFEVMGETIVGIQKAQGLPYRNLVQGARGDEIRGLILNVALNKDDEILYERSVQLEPSNQIDRGRGLRELFKR